MNSFISLYRKMLLGLVVTILCTTTAYANDFVGISCVDITTDQGTQRVLELAVSSVNENYFSLNGTHRDDAGETVGLAVGSALAVGNSLIATVNASTVNGSLMKSTLYQFTFNNSSWTGTFQSITQNNVATLTTTEYNSGSAAIPATCEVVTTPVDPPGNSDDSDDSQCTPNSSFELCGDGIDNDCNGYTDSEEFFICPPLTDPPTDGNTGVDVDKDGYDASVDCNDNDSSIYPGAPEQCGDNIAQNCGATPDAGCYASFADNGDGTLNQLETSLMWQQEHLDPVAELDRETVNWHSVTTYCEKLTLAGYSNWRLPTASELEGIVDLRNVPTIDPLFTGVEATYYWSSTTVGDYNAIDVDFRNGEADERNKQVTSGRGRCVRNR